MSGRKRRLSRHDDRPGYALGLWHLWQQVPATEELDGNDDAFTASMWSHYVHQIARESERQDGIPDLSFPLGPVGVDEEAGP